MFSRTISRTSPFTAARSHRKWLYPFLLGALAACGGDAHRASGGDAGVEGCGNGLVEPAEQCDDGNRVDDDGCSSACEFEYCGNGRVDRGEDCDGEPYCSPACRDTRAPQPDADGDGISDEEEGTRDSDGDGTPDREDLDSDDDGLSDMLEAGTRARTPLPPIGTGTGFPITANRLG